jgi:hypothetical protein
VRRALVLLLLIVGCSRPQSRCVRTCTRAAECARELKAEPGVDRGECIDECTKLDREPHTQRSVVAHVRCVDGAATCEDVLECP